MQDRQQLRAMRPLGGFVITFNDMVGHGLILPVLPFIVEDQRDVGVVMTAQWTGLFFGSIITGRMADILGTKRSSCACVLLVGTLFLATGLVYSNLAALILVRFLVGVFTPQVR